MEAHSDRVRELVQSISKFYESSTPFRIYHGNTNSTRPSSRTHANTVDISGFSHVISVNNEDKSCLVEPNVPMDALVAAALECNLVPPVIPEFPGITVGGAFAGTAGESSSFRHGFFEDCVNWAEIVLANGNVVTASATQNADLFHGSKGTFGTLGVGTLFEVRLVDAKRFVQVHYNIVANGILEAREIMERECAKPEHDVQFIDGIMFSKKTGVIVTGIMVDQPLCGPNDDQDSSLNMVTFSKASDPWYYLHVQNILNEQIETISKEDKPATRKDLIPLQDYLFRYDRGAFWTGRYAFEYFVTPFNWITRWALDSFMHTRTMYHALHRSGLMQKFIVQDMAVPWCNIQPFFEWLDTNLDIYPLWLAPLKLGKGGIHFNPAFNNTVGRSEKPDDFVLNVGVWGFHPHNVLKVNRDIEAELKELKGMKWLYSQTFYTEDEFWSIYDRKWYDDLRIKYNAKSLPDVYDKVGGTALNQKDSLTGIWKLWPLAGVYGVLSTLKGGDYLRKR